jgi:hypothetical protein
VGDSRDKFDVTAETEAKRELQRALQEWLQTDVQVQAYAHGGKLDVKINLPEVKQHLEEAYPGVSVAPYSDYKLTITEVRGAPTRR